MEKFNSAFSLNKYLLIISAVGTIQPSNLSRPLLGLFPFLNQSMTYNVDPRDAVHPRGSKNFRNFTLNFRTVDYGEPKQTLAFTFVEKRRFKYPKSQKKKRIKKEKLFKFFLFFSDASKLGFQIKPTLSHSISNSPIRTPKLISSTSIFSRQGA